jgi:amino acid transporter
MSWFAHAVACSLYALGFGAYFGHVLEGFGLNVSHIPYLSLETCLIFAYINFRGASETGKAGNIVTLAKVIVILLFIGIGGWVMRGMPEWKGNFDPFLPMGVGAVFSAMGLTFIAFQGYEVIAQCSEEVMDPTRNIPRAIFFALLIVIPIYLLVAIVAIGAIHGEGMPTWQFLGKMKELAIVEAARQFAPGGGTVLLIGGLLSTASALLATVYSSSRVAFAMARDHNLPAFLGRVHTEKKTPHFAIVASAVIVIFMAIALPIEDVASAADIMFLLVFLQVNVTLIRMRKTHPGLKRGFKVPLVPLIPALGILTQLFIAIYMFVYSPKAWVSAGVWLVIGVAVYKLYASRTEEEALSVLALADAEEARKDYRVLVVPFRQEQVRPLMRIACALAKNYEGEVTAVSVIEAPRKVPLNRYTEGVQEARTLLRLVENIADEAKVEFTRLIKISHRLSYGILETAREEKSNFILLGSMAQEEGGLVDQVKEIVLLNVLEHAPCNVAILHGELPGEVKRLLLAVTDTPSCRLAVNIAPARIRPQGSGAARLLVDGGSHEGHPLPTPRGEDHHAVRGYSQEHRRASSSHRSPPHGSLPSRVEHLLPVRVRPDGRGDGKRLRPRSDSQTASAAEIVPALRNPHREIRRSHARSFSPQPFRDHVGKGLGFRPQLRGGARSLIRRHRHRARGPVPRHQDPELDRLGAVQRKGVRLPVPGDRRHSLPPFRPRRSDRFLDRHPGLLRDGGARPRIDDDRDAPG